MSTISAIIPFYGDPAETLPLVNSLRDESVTQIIVADDCSPVPFPPVEGVTVVRASANRGFGSTVNLGASQASGDLLLVLNSDLTIHPGFVAALVKGAEPWQPAVASPSIRESGRARAVGKFWPRSRQAFFAWLTPLARLRDTSLWNTLVGHVNPKQLSPAGTPVDWVVGACMLIPAADFRRIGGFDERYFMNSEEIDLQRRLLAEGVRSVVLPSIVVDHEGGGSSDPERRRQWVIDGQFIYEAKWGHAAPLALALLTASLINFGWNCMRRLRGADVRPLATLEQEGRLVYRGWMARSGRPHPAARPPT